MLNALQTKILLAILAAVTVLGGYAFHEHEVKVAARKHDAETWKFVHDQRQKNNANPTNGSKTWTHSLP